MRILMFGWEFPPYLSGGLGTACYDMTAALAQKGTKIIFVQPRVEGAEKIHIEKGLMLRSADGQEIRHVVDKLNYEAHDLWAKNVDVRTVDSPLLPYLRPETYDDYVEYLNRERKVKGSKETDEYSTIINLRGGYGGNLMAEVYRFSYAAAAIAWELRDQYDIIHVHDWMTYPAGVLAKRITGKPLIAHSHSLEYDRSGQNMNPELAHIEWLGLTTADRIVAVSQYTKSLIIKHYKIPDEKIDVVHNAVTKANVAREYHIPELRKNEKLVLFLGRITYQKGPEYFVEAARLVLNRLPHVRFVMAGSGDMLLNLVRRVGQLRMGDHFHFTGFMNRQAIERIFALSDLYVMPSVSEPFGITPLEAMTSDVPVLISRQSGVSEVLTGALKVDYWDVKEMANKICAVLSYPVLAAEVVKRCHKDLTHIKWENAAEHLNQIYSQFA